MHKLLFGQYTHRDSFIHSLDPRVKILSLVIFSILVAITKSLPAAILFSALALLLVAAAQLKWMAVLRSMKPFAYFFALILFMYLVFTPERIDEGVRTVWRFVMFIVLALLLSATTPLNALIYGLEKLLYPLKWIKVSSRTVSLLITLTIRFIPVLFLQAKALHDARIARLGSMKSPKHVVLFFQTLLDRMLRSASTVSDAILARGYTNERRSSYLSLRLGKRDYLAGALVIVFCALVLFLSPGEISFAH